MKFENNLTFACSLDSKDPLASFRDKFYIPDGPFSGKSLYFTGNSLGLQPKSTREYIEQELSDWQHFGVEGHFHARNPWMPYHEFVAEKLGRVVGAKTNEVVAMGSLTANLHLLMVSFYRPSGNRRKILIEANAFPSDMYAVKSQIEFHGGVPENDLIILPLNSGSDTHPSEDILRVIEENSDELSLIMMSGVNYYTGQAFDMKAITKKAHSCGIICGFDLAHATGNLKMNLHDWGVDFAAWCSYKYLNAGPGGIAGLFVHEHHTTDSSLPRFAGWWGNNKVTRFEMLPDFDPMPGADSWQLSNPPILQLAALRASLDIFEEAGMDRLREKSDKLTAFMEYLIEGIPSENIKLITPKNPNDRGAQLSIRVIGADKSLFDELTKSGVMADWRSPDVIRLAPTPLYNTYEDVFLFCDLLKELLNK
jgi:kynureninase